MLSDQGVDRTELLRMSEGVGMVRDGVTFTDFS